MRRWPCAKAVEHPVLSGRGDVDPDLAPAEPFGGPLGDVISALDGVHAMVRDFFDTIADAGPEQRVGAADLARVIESAALVERAASAVGVVAIAGYARREAHDDARHPERGVTSIRARGFVDEWAAPALGHLLRISSRTADTRVTRDADLASVMPHTVAAVADGRLELWQTVGCLEVLREAGADDETIRAVDAWLTTRLATTDPSRLRPLTRYALARVRPDLLPAAARKNRARRAIERWEREPGLTEITARVPTEKAAAMWEAATTLAKEYIALDPALTLDQARCDAFVDLVLSDVTVTTHVTLGVPVVTSAYAATGEAPVPAPDPEDPGPFAEPPPTPEDPASRVTDPENPEDPRPSAEPPPTPEDPVPATDLRPDVAERLSPATPPGERDSRYRGPGARPLRVPDWAAHPHGAPVAGRAAPGDTPAAELRWWLSGVHLPGLGYVPPDVVQSLTCELGAVISTALLDSTRGTLLCHVDEAYRPPAAMRRMVELRDGRCRAFGCTRPARRCDLDHATPFDRGGETSAANLAGLCRFHHRAKQQKQWRYLLDPDTGVTWWVHAVTGAMRTTVADVCLGVHDPGLAPVGEAPQPDNSDDRHAPTGDHAYDPGQPGPGRPASATGRAVSAARTPIPDPTIPF